jgi:hypothetical protein
VTENLVSVLDTIYRELETAPPHPALSALAGRRGNRASEGVRS